jgi:hypothetical protein
MASNGTDRPATEHQAMTPEEWAKEQLKPLSMFEIAKWWADGIKVAASAVRLIAVALP